MAVLIRIFPYRQQAPQRVRQFRPAQSLVQVRSCPGLGKIPAQHNRRAGFLRHPLHVADHRPHFLIACGRYIIQKLLPRIDHDQLRAELPDNRPDLLPVQHKVPFVLILVIQVFPVPAVQVEHRDQRVLDSVLGCHIERCQRFTLLLFLQPSVELRRRLQPVCAVRHNLDHQAGLAHARITLDHRNLPKGDKRLPKPFNLFCLNAHSSFSDNHPDPSVLLLFSMISIAGMQVYFCNLSPASLFSVRARCKCTPFSGALSRHTHFTSFDVTKK